MSEYGLLNILNSSKDTAQMTSISAVTLSMRGTSILILNAALLSLLHAAHRHLTFPSKAKFFPFLDIISLWFPVKLVWGLWGNVIFFENHIAKCHYFVSPDALESMIE